MGGDMIQGIVVAVNVIGNLIAIPSHGAKGAAFMTVVSEAACSLGYATYLLASARRVSGGVQLDTLSMRTDGRV